MVKKNIFLLTNFFKTATFCFVDTYRKFYTKLYLIFKLYNLYVKKYLLNIIISVCLMVVVALLTSCIAYIVGPIINKIFVDKNKSLLIVICFTLILIYIVKSVCAYIQTVCLQTVIENIIMDIRVNLFDKIIKMPMKNFDDTQNGKIMSVFLNDVDGIGSSIEELFVTAIRDFITVFFLVVLVFYNNFLLATVSFCIYPIIFVPLKKITSSVEEIFKKKQEYLQMLSAKLVDVTNGIKTIKSYNTEHTEVHRMKHLLLALKKVILNVARKKALLSPSVELASGLSVSLVIFIGGWQIINGYSDVGKFFTFFTALVMAHRPARSLSGVGLKLRNCLVHLERVFSFTDKLTVEDFEHGEKPNIANSVIKFEHVCFNYSINNGMKMKNKDCSILSDISLEIKPRQKIALVGLSGSGKSTIVALLMRLYDCLSGQISIGNLDIHDINLSYLRNNISYVGQNNFLFDDTIKNNILYGTIGKSRNNVALPDAIKDAQIDFLSDLVYGVSEYVGYNGSRFSLGQQQRIAIARAIVKNAPIVVFDEATSALDANTEKAIRDMIFNKMKDKTVIIIAHRLSTVVDCDNIYVMEKGRIVESGTHDQLLNGNGVGIYKCLWANLNNQVE